MTKPDRELKIVSQILGLLSPLREVQKCRVIDYVASRIETDGLATGRPALAAETEAEADADFDEVRKATLPPSIGELFARTLARPT